MLATWITLSGLTASYGNASSPAQKTSVPVVLSSFAILNDVADHLLPDSFQTQSLIAPESDSHSYKLSAQDALKFQKADLILIWGLGFDSTLESTANKAGFKSKIRVVTKGIETLKRFEPAYLHKSTSHQHGEVDPHLWQSPSKMIEVVRNITTILGEKFPDSKSEIDKKSLVYMAQLEELNIRYKNEIMKIPAEKRRMATSHDAFAYLGQELGLEIFPLQGLDPEQTPSLKVVQSFIRTLREKNVKMIFKESGQSSQLIERVASDQGLKVVGPLYSDSLSPQDGVTQYHELLDANLKTILKALKESAK